MLLQTKVDERINVFAVKLSKVSGDKHSRKWKCKLDEVFVGDYLIVPLTSVKKLKSEAYLMNNCCCDYARQCANLEYGIFSIRSRSGVRLATLGLILAQGYWRFDQCFGPANMEVLEESLEYYDDDGVLHSECYPTELYYVAHDIVRMMNADMSN